MTQREKAERLRRLQQQGSRLLLPNAWDVASARLFEDAGFPAIGTTSAGVAFALGYPDGEVIEKDEMLRSVARITSKVRVPVTADIESGYGDLVGTIKDVIEAGAVGVNLEDSTGDPTCPLHPVAIQAERIRSARAAAQRTEIPLVINARIDTYMAEVSDGQARLQETIERGRAYLQAGADSVFVPLVSDRPTIQVLVREIPGPLNLMAGAGSPSALELFNLGVARVSMGPSIMLAAMGLVKEIALELRAHETHETLSRYPYSFGEA